MDKSKGLVFLLDDEESERTYFKETLEEISYQVVSCYCVTDAINVFDQTGDVYQKYFLDMTIPRRPNIGANWRGSPTYARYLIKQGVDPKKIIIMSAEVSDNDKIAAREHGMPPEQIVSKGKLTYKRLKEILEV